MNNRGETLIELVVSMALLSIVVTMLVTVFTATSQVLFTTIDTKRSMNNQASGLLMEASESGASYVDVKDTLEITTHYEVVGTPYDNNFQTELLQSTEGSLYKFR